MDPPPASFYGKVEKKNPVVLAFTADIKEFKSYVKRLKESSYTNHNAYARGAKKVFEIWNKYKPRLPPHYFSQNLLQTADFLYNNKLHKLALWQGYGRHLQELCTSNIENVKDVDHLKSSFFPDGFDTEQANLTFRALQGQILCSYYLEKEKGEQLSRDRLQKLLRLLGFLRILMQAVLPHERLFWILYNGSLHIYNICRFLMSSKQSAQALEFLLWASVCLEVSIPLLNAHFVTWRATLYCAVCQCYYEEHHSAEAEVFARRALKKMSDLETLERMSGSEVTVESQLAYKEASVKLTAMVFKRSVFETRRTYKCLLKSEQIEEIQNVPWPRNSTEHLLMEMFQGDAAQFLAMMEALWDTTRRPLQVGLPKEPDIQEVMLELLFAGVRLLSGNGSSRNRICNSRLPSCVNGISTSLTLMELAAAGEDKISVEAAVKFVKLLFLYEQWHMFSHLSHGLQQVLSEMKADNYRKAELELTLLEAVAPLISPRKFQRPNSKDENTKQLKVKIGPSEILSLVQALHVSVCTSQQDIQPDGDLVVDIILFLWSKCKPLFQKRQESHQCPVYYLGKKKEHDKWLKILLMLNEVAYMCNLVETDPWLAAEVTFRLATVLENSASSPLHYGRRTATTEDSSLDCTSVDKHSTSSISLMSPNEQLQIARDVLEKGIEALSRGRTRFLPSDGSAIVDKVFMHKYGKFDRTSFGGGEPANFSFSLLQDVHLELLVLQHRVELQLQNTTPETVLLERIGKNKISRALFLTQKALLSYRNDQRNTQDLLEVVLLLEKAEQDEKRLFTCSAAAEEKSKAPPPPVLQSRSNHTMVFKPASYALEDQVSWYQIFGRKVEGNDMKVRLGDCQLIGTGDMIPSVGECLLSVEGLQCHQNYIFSVAAYDAQGNLVGGTIGKSTKPILASLPLPLLNSWAYLAQAAYQTAQPVLAMRACSEIWSHFTHPTTPSSDNDAPAFNMEGLSPIRLRMEILHLSSAHLQQLFFSCIFIQTDIHVQELVLYCNSLCDEGPLIWKQKARLAESEHVMVAMDLALWLNDHSGALQAVVQCYGLLVPFLYHHIQSEAVVQTLMKCLLVLLEICDVLKEKRPNATAKALHHMVAAITYYIAKGLHHFKEDSMAVAVIEQGKRLLQEMTELTEPSVKQDIGEKRSLSLPVNAELEVQLKALEVLTNRGVTSLHSGPWNRDTNTEPAVLYSVVEVQPLKLAFKEVMKVRGELCFLELTVLLFQRALRENQQQLLLQWEQDVFSWLSRRDKNLTGVKLTRTSNKKELKEFTTSVIEYDNKKSPKAQTSKTNEKNQKKILLSALKEDEPTKIEQMAVDTLLFKLFPLVQKWRRRRHPRQVCADECHWRCHLNLSLAHAHLGHLYHSLHYNQDNRTELCYNQLPSSFFSLSCTGILLKWKTMPQSGRFASLPAEAPKYRPQAKSNTKMNKSSEYLQNGKRSYEEGSDTAETDKATDLESPHMPSQFMEQPADSPRSPSLPHQHLDILNLALVHLRRAMVLAHRIADWSSLVCVCSVLWDQFIVVTGLIETGQVTDLSMEQFYKVITPLLVLAADFLMDMMDHKQLWNVYVEEDTELKYSLHFSTPLDDVTQVDLRWLRSLTLDTLELLHYQAKWETLVHLALKYNHYTRERYTHMITPLMVHAQRMLVERIKFCGGPPVPQPHFLRTREITKDIISCRNYVGRQLLLGWTPGSKSYASTSEPLPLAERQRAMCLVCVPLDVEDTLQCFREVQHKTQHATCSFQHSRTLLLQFLAHNQHYIGQSFYKKRDGQALDKVELNVVASTVASINPPDLSTEDFSSQASIYSCPLPPSQLTTVLSSYLRAIDGLTSKHHSLGVLAQHDLGNLHFYNGNLRAAHSCWNKALGCALQISEMSDPWDSLSCRSPEEILKHAGIWGCLQAAVLMTKIAQYILTSDIGQRTKCCLLAAHLFKCLLAASMPHPKDDISYISYTLDSDVVPGLDLFSEPHRGDIGSTVSSITFLSHWLYSTGHLITMQPVLCLYLYMVDKVCRDTPRTIKCRILKVRSLAELGMFQQAVREMNRLINAEDLPRPYGSNHNAERTMEITEFCDRKKITDSANLQSLEDLVKRKVTSDIRVLYGPKLCLRLLLAQAQLILALCKTVHNLPDSLEPEPTEPTDVQDSEMSRRSTSPDLLFDPQKQFTPGRVKALLLSEVSSMIALHLPSNHAHIKDPEELELSVDTIMLLSAVYLEQGKTAGSIELVICAMRLLDSAMLKSNPSCTTTAQPPEPSRSTVKLKKCHQERISKADWPLKENLTDFPQGEEARERMNLSLWLNCRLALVQSLVTHFPVTSIMPSKQSNLMASKCLAEGLQEAEALKDRDTQALLLLQGVILDTLQGQPRESRDKLLQEAVTLLSGHRNRSLRSDLVLAKATLMLCNLRNSRDQSLLVFNQKLLKKQLFALGESIDLEEGGTVLIPSSPGFQNIYHPQLLLLAKTTMSLGVCVAVKTITDHSEEGAELDQPLLLAHRVLDSALQLTQAAANGDSQLEADIYYCMGMVEKHLVSLGGLQPHSVAQTFMRSITVCTTHNLNLLQVRRCYLEMALLFLQQWQRSYPGAQNQLTSTPNGQNNGSLTEEVCQLLSWLCVRTAKEIAEANANCSHLLDAMNSSHEHISSIALKSLPLFVTSGMNSESPLSLGLSTEPGLSSGTSRELIWADLSHYYTHLTNLLNISLRSVGPECLDGLVSLLEDSTISLRLVHLQTFFSSFLPSYKESCLSLQLPISVIQQPNFIQSKQANIEMYPWAAAKAGQLCIQWHQQSLEKTENNQKQILLFYAFNKTTDAVTVADLQVGQYVVSLYRLNGVHDQLHRACMSLNRPTPPPQTSTASLKPRLSETPDKGTHSEPQQQVSGDTHGNIPHFLCTYFLTHNVITLLKAQTYRIAQQQLRTEFEQQCRCLVSVYQVQLEESCCFEIRNLLVQPQCQSTCPSEVPFEVNLQTLQDLERCFNPSRGATLEEEALVTWILSLLQPMKQ
ncbi:cilia- and flagella-associated protein 54 isoform X2 [Denticeps clupeoides]|uniref:cilia- and flagella-associated protein 54 isoform X2 n=1 Tax=Denticeps clupeoides TaxID=299321 RepID=UPI0010A4A077|nr:cilia- and flagella-associated protein 54 isoform X2 [Denticeps clupeoides]